MDRPFGLTVMFFALCISAAQAKDEQKPPPVPDQKRLGGDWRLDSWFQAGEVRPIVEGTRLVVREDLMVLGVLKDKKMEGMAIRYTIDPAKTPKQMDWSIEIGEGKTVKQLAVYSLEADTLKICMAPDGKPRPDEFVVRKGEARLLWTFSRVINQPK